MSASRASEERTDERAGSARPRKLLFALVVVGSALLGCGLVAYLVQHRLGEKQPAAGLAVHPTATVLMSIRELSRLETNEIHVEKVVDLTDRQSRFFGLFPANDAILLVAAGDITVGIDLGKLRDADVTVDRATGQARLVLPLPEVLSARLDEAHTYVYQRTTSVLARRNEQLESQARKEALRAITEVARDAAVMEKARVQAEKQLQFLMQRFGIAHTTIGWQPS